MLLLRFCICVHTVAYASWRSFLGCFVFMVSLDDNKGRGEVGGGVGAHIRGGCTGRHFGRFGVQGGFRRFWRLFTFVFMCVGHRRTGGGCSQRWVVCPGCFHSVHGCGVARGMRNV